MTDKSVLKSTQERPVLLTGATRNNLNIDLIRKTAAASLPKKHRTDEGILTVQAYFEDARPADPVEGMVYGQLYAMHAHAMELMADAQKTMSVDAKDQYLKMANRLIKTFNASLDALGKVKRGGRQTIRVENVHVSDGGQAIVGGNFKPGRDRGY